MFPVLFYITIFLVGGTATRSLRQRYLLDTEVLRELDAWELKQLRDFVRGKGRGSVSRFPVELLESQDPKDEPMLNLMDPMIMNQGGLLKISQSSNKITPTGFIASSTSLLEKVNTSKVNSKTSHKPSTTKRPTTKVPDKRPRPKKEDEPTKETFKEMADIFQAIVSRRQTMLKEARESTSAMGTWEPMNPKEESDDSRVDIKPSHIPIESTHSEHENMSKEEYEAKLQSLSRQLTEIMALIQKTKDRRPVHQKLPPRPKLTIIRNGTAEQTKDGQYEFIATISLIQDGGKNILVDTGMGTDINGRTHLLAELSSLGLAPPNINVVVSTHGHPDHNGGLHDFPDAIHYQGWYQHYQSRFNLSGLFEGDRHQLTENVYLLRSPGHSSDDLAVIVKDEATFGSSVAIAGDTFLRKEDIDYQMMWKPLSANENQQAESRRRLACGQWRWIVPGHGSPFPLEASLRAKFGC